MPTSLGDLYSELTQKLDKILEPRYYALKFENGELIPTMTDLEPGIKEIAYPRMNEVGDAQIMSDGAIDFPLVYLTGEVDRYPVYMLINGFIVTFQESRSLSRMAIDNIERRMAAARRAMAQRINELTALGTTSLNFKGALTNSLVTTDNSSVNIYTANYQTVLDFFVSTIRSLTGNYVTSLPTEMIVNVDIMSRLIALENAQGTYNVRDRLQAIFPGLTITEVPQATAAKIDGSGITRPGNGKDRIFLYPNESMTLNRHIEQSIADLIPEEFVKSVMIKDQLSKVYGLFSCITPTIFDYPQDCRYVDIPTKS